MKLVYSDGYDLHVPLLDHLHRFDGRKYSRAYAVLRAQFGATTLGQMTHSPFAKLPRPICCLSTPRNISNL